MRGSSFYQHAAPYLCMTTSDLDALRNLGALRLGKLVPSGAKTIIVVGVARGGTSMVAGVLRHLGVFLGDDAVPPVFEDVRLATPIEAKEDAASRAIIEEYNRRHPVWGFKRPGLIDHLASAHRLFRNPVYVVIFRDVLAIANRNALSVKSDPLRSIKYSLKQYQLVREFIESYAPPALLLSNEKALIHAATFVNELDDWLGLGATAQQKEAAIASIVIDQPQYLNASRLQFLGRLDKATTAFVAGWAFIRGRPGAATMEVVCGDRVLASVVADRHRPDVQRRGVHPTGFCGFRYDFKPGDGVAVGDSVTVRFAVGGEVLNGAPRELEAPPTPA